jgi:hypothetical protein
MCYRTCGLLKMKTIVIASRLGGASGWSRSAAVGCSDEVKELGELIDVLSLTPRCEHVVCHLIDVVGLAVVLVEGCL